MGRTPVAIITGLETTPPARPASAPQLSERNTRRPGPSGSLFKGSDSMKSFYPQAIDRSVGDAQNQPVEDVPHERTEKLAAAIRGPV